MNSYAAQLSHPRFDLYCPCANVAATAGFPSHPSKRHATVARVQLGAAPWQSRAAVMLHFFVTFLKLFIMMDIAYGYVT